MSSEIARQFVEQYYRILTKQPWELHHFYQDTSIYTVRYGNGSAYTETVQGGQQIGSRIQESLPNRITPEESEKGVTTCEIHNLNWMHQVSLPGSLLVMVSGSQVAPKNGPSKRFTQTFLLASMPKQPASFYVHNDICIFEPEVAPVVPAGVQIPNGAAMMGPGPQGLVPMSPPGAKMKPAPAPAAVDISQPPAPEKDSNSPKFGTVPEEHAGPASLDIGKPTIPASAAPVAPNPTVDPTEDDEVEEPPAEEANAEEANAEEANAEDTEAAEQVDAPKDAPAPTPASPMSWAAMAAAHKPDPKPVPQPKQPRKANEKAEGEEKEEAVAEGAETAPAVPRKEKPPVSKPQESAELEASVFVSGVPNTCDENKLKEIFGQYGEVVKVSLKAEKHFAIIDFNRTDAATEALKTPALKCDSSIMKVEPRRKAGAVKSRGKGEGRGSGERGRGKGRDSGSRGAGGKRGPREARE